MSTKKNEGAAMRDAAEERVKKQTARLTLKKLINGTEVFQECEAQAIRAKFTEEGRFLHYYSRYSGKEVSTSLPALDGQTKEEYIVALTIHKEGKNMLTKTKKQKTIKPKTAKPKKEGTRAHNMLDTDKSIHILVKENPRREGCPGWENFNLYKEGMIVEDYLKLEGAGRNHLRFDISKGFVKLV